MINKVTNLTINNARNSIINKVENLTINDFGKIQMEQLQVTCKSNLRAIQPEFLTKAYWAAGWLGLDKRKSLCWFLLWNQVLSQKINQLWPSVLRWYRRHSRSRLLQFSISLRLRLRTTWKQTGLLRELVGLVSTGLLQLTVAVELFLLLDVPVQPRPLFSSVMVALEI